VKHKLPHPLRTAKEGKRLSAIIKEEGKAEKAALNVTIDELAELQTLQRAAVKVGENPLLVVIPFETFLESREERRCI